MTALGARAKTYYPMARPVNSAAIRRHAAMIYPLLTSTRLPFRRLSPSDGINASAPVSRGREIEIRVDSWIRIADRTASAIGARSFPANFFSRAESESLISMCFRSPTADPHADKRGYAASFPDRVFPIAFSRTGE